MIQEELLQERDRTMADLYSDDGWDHNRSSIIDEFLMFSDEVAKLAYEFRNARRGTYALSDDTHEELLYAIESLEDSLKSVSKQVNKLSD